jgi:steroid 5-alpha reductase family enzyme
MLQIANKWLIFFLLQVLSLYLLPLPLLHAFLTSALDGSEWSASFHGHFTPGERNPNTH